VQILSQDYRGSLGVGIAGSMTIGVRLSCAEALIDQFDRQTEPPVKLTRKTLATHRHVVRGTVRVKGAPHHQPLGLPLGEQSRDGFKAARRHTVVDLRKRPRAGGQGVAHSSPNPRGSKIKSEQRFVPLRHARRPMQEMLD
jgi:hypothetical protein